MVPAPSLQGHRRQHWAEPKNEKAPSVTGGAQKISVRNINARETSLNHPLKVDSRLREVHTMIVRWKSRMTILLKCRMHFAMPATDRKGEPVAELRIFVNSICTWRAASRRVALAARRTKQTPSQHKQTEWRLSVCHFTKKNRRVGRAQRNPPFLHKARGGSLSSGAPSRDPFALSTNFHCTPGRYCRLVPTVPAAPSVVTSMPNRPTPIGLVSNLASFRESAASVSEPNSNSALPELSPPTGLPSFMITDRVPSVTLPLDNRDFGTSALAAR
jgi:hypothetical protein